MAYKVQYDGESDVLSIFISPKGKLAYAEEMGDLILHVDNTGKPLFLEILHASDVLPALVQAYAKKESVLLK